MTAPAPELAASGDAPRRSLLQRLLSRPERIVAACLAAAAGLAWLWLASMSGPAGEMDMPGMTAPVWSAAYLGPAFAMWALMMVAMMLPAAAPMILLYERVARRAPGGSAATFLFVSAYLAIWTGFSAAAAAAQALLISSEALSAATLSLGDRTLAAGLLLFVALYQLSPAKRACLRQCRSPLAFVMRLWRPGPGGALRLGLAHGLYCLGCCWLLMLLLFVGGVMNLAWVALLAAIVFAEKLAPPAWRVDRLVALALVAGALWLVVR